MSGKSKCKILKKIRQQIAAENDIEFITSMNDRIAKWWQSKGDKAT
jgi:hypothetical protein